MNLNFCVKFIPLFCQLPFAIRSSSWCFSHLHLPSENVADVHAHTLTIQLINANLFSLLAKQTHNGFKKISRFVARRSGWDSNILIFHNFFHAFRFAFGVRALIIHDVCRHLYEMRRFPRA